MKLWDKGFSTDEKIDFFTVGNDRELDLVLARFDVIGSRAHAAMLFEIGLLSEDEWNRVEEELNALLDAVMREHMRADVPFGLFLSGGLDSATTLAIAGNRPAGTQRRLRAL